MKRFFPLLSLLLFFSCSKKQADLIIHHGVIYTVDSSFRVVEAMAIQNGKILATGTNDAILAAYTAKEQVNASGAPIYPGWIDAHAHFVGYGQSLYKVDLFGTSTWEETVERVKQFAAQHPELEWIEGRGWDQNKWQGKQFPTNKMLNDYFPDRPVVLSRMVSLPFCCNESMKLTMSFGKPQSVMDVSPIAKQFSCAFSNIFSISAGAEAGMTL